MLKYLLLLLFVSPICVAVAQDANPNLNIIPAPVSVKKAEGSFSLSRATILQADTPTNKAVTFFTGALVNCWGFYMPPVKTDNTVSSNVIRLTSEGADLLPQDGYHISISP